MAKITNTDKTWTINTHAAICDDCKTRGDNLTYPCHTVHETTRILSNEEGILKSFKIDKVLAVLCIRCLMHWIKMGILKP